MIDKGVEKAKDGLNEIEDGIKDLLNQLKTYDDALRASFTLSLLKSLADCIKDLDDLI